MRLADDGRKFTGLYNVQHLQSAQLDRVSRVCISNAFTPSCVLFSFSGNTDATGTNCRVEDKRIEHAGKEHLSV